MFVVKNLKEKLFQIAPISLEEIAECRLLNRIDTKYLCNVKILPKILERADNDFRIQQIGDQRIFKYESLYFDTPSLKTYFDHHQGKRLRYKIRFRRYVDTKDSFLEVKKKKNYIRTDKRRIQSAFSSKLEETHIKFIKEQVAVPKVGLNATIWTIFDRITLAGKNHIERITIDTNVRFKNEFQEVCLPGLSIIEIKRDKTAGISPFTQILRDYNIRPYGVSKYILGNVLLNPILKHNRFLKKVVTVNKICHDS